MKHEGQYVIQVNPEIKQKINEIKEGIVATARRWEYKYNPIKIVKRIDIDWSDFNPFDDDDDEIG